MESSNLEINQLLNDLSSEDTEKQLRAVTISGQQKLSLMVPDIVKLMEDLTDPYHPTIRQLLETVIWALGEIGDPRAIPALIRNLDNVFYKIQDATMIALGKLGAEEAVEPIWEVVTNNSYPQFVQLVAVEALGCIANQAAKNHLQELVENPRLANLLKEKASKMLHSIQGFW